MDQLTKNDLQPLDIAALLQQAEAIRDAVLAKTISARQVGELFCALITACGDVSTAVHRLLSANASDSAPLRVDVTDYPATITSTNTTPRKIAAGLFPRFCLGAVLFIGDHQAVKVTPDGIVTPLRPGTSMVTAVATSDTSVYKSLRIEVVPPRLRLARTGALRLDADGNIRLT